MRRKPPVTSNTPPTAFNKGEYKGLKISVIRPGALDVLRAPSRFGNNLLHYKLAFDREK